MTRIFCLLFSFSFLLSGCGTLANIEGKENWFMAPDGVQKPRYYGGVLFWSDCITEIIDNSHEFESGMLLDYPLIIPYFAFIAVDIPLSAAADTLTLPIVAIERRYWKNISGFDSDLSVAEDTSKLDP